MLTEVEYAPYSAKELMLKFRSENPRYFTDAPDTPKFPNKLLRIHRAIRWFERAEKESDDPDAAFIFCWIAFNAAYARDMPRERLGEADNFRIFIKNVNEVDERDVIKNYVRQISAKIEELVADKYLFDAFWKYQKGIDRFAKWERCLNNSVRLVKCQIESDCTSEVIAALFDRLYTLRNQLVHGGATWNSSVNRVQVEDGAEIMRFLVPVFIDLMMDNAHIFNDPPYYPFVGP